MGANSRRRRASQQRRSDAAAGGAHPFGTGRGGGGPSAYATVELAVLGAAGWMSAGKVGADERTAIVEDLKRRTRAQPADLLDTVLADLLARQAQDALAGGWGRGDLTELVRRRVGAHALRFLDAALAAARPRLGTTEALVTALQLHGVLARAPRVAASDLIGTAADAEVTEHPKLARVRALLAKAESTEYDEEAEALSAKAQELISRYALDRLVDQHRDGARGDLAVRRLWLDPPYVGAKAMLVHQVARANRTRSATAESLGFCLLVGDPADLDAVELLVTSLLVQADAAMLRHGGRPDPLGRSRTRSFRRSFLLAYAGRIGERLRAAAETVATAEGGADRLPVLRDHDERVATAFAQALPGTVTKRSTFSNWEGWAAGVAAADLASLDAHGRLAEPAGGTRTPDGGTPE